MIGIPSGTWREAVSEKGAEYSWREENSGDVENQCACHIYIPRVPSFFLNLISQPGLCVVYQQWHLKVISFFKLCQNTIPVSIQLQLSLSRFALNLPSVKNHLSVCGHHSYAIPLKHRLLLCGTLIKLMHTQYNLEEYF